MPLPSGVSFEHSIRFLPIKRKVGRGREAREVTERPVVDWLTLKNALEGLLPPEKRTKNRVISHNLATDYDRKEQAMARGEINFWIKRLERDRSDKILGNEVKVAVSGSHWLENGVRLISVEKIQANDGPLLDAVSAAVLAVVRPMKIE